MSHFNFFDFFILVDRKLLYLASKSPRRLAILREVCRELRISVRAFGKKSLKGMEEKEVINKNETPLGYVTRVAMEKAMFSSRQLSKSNQESNPVLCGDTIVCLGGKIFLKPRSRSNIVEMLTELSNKEHKVITSIVLALPLPDQPKTFKFLQVNTFTTVHFTKIPNAWIRDYAETEEAFDKSGSYGIQGRCSVFISKISGSYSSVVGLPIHETYELLLKHM